MVGMRLAMGSLWRGTRKGLVRNPTALDSWELTSCCVKAVPDSATLGVVMDRGSGGGERSARPRCAAAVDMTPYEEVGELLETV